MTINKFIEKVIEDLGENQIVTIYNNNHNIIYHGKANYAPLNLYNTYKESYLESKVDIDGNMVTDLIINGRR